MNKPIVVARHDLINDLAETLNKAEVPAFVKVEVVERLLDRLKQAADVELHNEVQKYMQATHMTTSPAQENTHE